MPNQTVEKLYEGIEIATGIKVGAYNFLIAVTIAVIIVLAMNLVGLLLISALIIFSALSAMRLLKSVNFHQKL